MSGEIPNTIAALREMALDDTLGLLRDLVKRLHDAEVALAAWMEWKKVQEVDRVALTDALTAAQAELREYRELGAETGRELVEQRDAAEARIDALEEALRELLDAYCQAMAGQYDFPGSPWTMERGHRRNGAVPDTTALAARALLSPAPADAAGGPEA